MSKSLAFSFGEPESVLSNNMMDSLGIYLNPWFDYYEPPISQDGLAKLLGANAHHGTIPYLRSNMLAKYFDADKSKALRRADIFKASFDYDIFGHCYFQKIYNRLGQIVRLQHLPAKPMRKAKSADVYCQIKRDGSAPITYKPGEVIQLKRYDVNQNIYGSVEYFGAINSVLLNQDAVLFRRKYFLNGAHMGYIFYVADGDFSKKDEDDLKEKIRGSKGVGNFRSMFLNLPGGKKDSVQIIPVGDVSQKDEFERIKNITRADILAAWRIQPALAGVMPESQSGFGDIAKISAMYFEYETEPRQQVFLELNDYLPRDKKVYFAKPE